MKDFLIDLLQLVVMSSFIAAVTVLLVALA